MITKNRFIENEIINSLKFARIVEILGARQVGKSTIAKKIAFENENSKYVTLDDKDTALWAKNDRVGFIRQNLGGLLVIDEIQLVSDLIPELKKQVDNNPEPGHYIITGSANLSDLKPIHESLAGRAMICEMMGFSQDEIIGKQSNWLKCIFNNELNKQYTSKMIQQDYLKIMEIGAYPDVVMNDENFRKKWFKNYLNLIFNRDAKDISDLRRIGDLPKMLKYLSSILGKELVLSNMANDISIPRTTLDPYLDLLETMFIIKKLDSWSGNLTSQVVSNKKTFILDSGIASYYNKGKNLGGIFESFIASEVQKQILYSQEEIQMFHFRDYNKNEVDLILENEQNEIVAIEIKLTSTPNYSDGKILRLLKNKYGSKMKYGIVLYTGQETKTFDDGILTMPASSVWDR
ncbi:MAG: ATP-binding protein [Candidatus Ancillula sp.]|jgi:predicted AAA+ superfamily ATPase|nr:ATP-binding protein [Candidatus Ancillula sp.]